MKFSYQSVMSQFSAECPGALQIDGRPCLYVGFVELRVLEKRRTVSNSCKRLTAGIIPNAEKAFFWAGGFLRLRIQPMAYKSFL